MDGNRKLPYHWECQNMQLLPEKSDWILMFLLLCFIYLCILGPGYEEII